MFKKPPPDDDSSDEGDAPSPGLVRSGSPGWRSASRGPDDIDPLADTFNRNRERIGELVVDQPRDFTSEVTDMRTHIRHLSSRVWTTARWLMYLDITVGCAVLFTAIASPVDVTMSRTPSLNIVALVGFACNGVFALDLLIRFNRGYRDLSNKGGGKWVRKRGMIAMNYFKSWFLVDVFAACPLDLPFVLGILDASQPGFGLRAVTFMRLVRCLKVVQVMPTILQVLSTRMAMSNSSTELFKFGVLLIMLVHYLACFWAFIGLNWEPSEDSSAANEQTWIVSYGFENYSMHRLYAISMYVSIVAIFGGVSSVSPQNFVEYCALSMMMLVGGLTWAYVLSMLCAIFSKLDPRETEFKNLMDELGIFMEERDFESDHRQRLRDFFTYTKDYARESGYSLIFERMSNKLRADTALIMGEAHVQLVWYLRKSNCEIGFLCEVALNLKPALYEIHEPLPIKKLTVVQRGLVAQRMRLIGAGKVLGVDCILKEHHIGLRDLDPVMCLSYVHVATVSRDTMFELAKEYPMATKTLHAAARHMTVRAALILYYRKFVRHNRKLPGRIDLNDLAGAIYDKRLGRRSSSSGGLKPGKEMIEQGDSSVVEREISELKKMVMALVDANALPGGAMRSRTKTPPPDGSPTQLRRQGSRGNKLADVRSGSTGGGGGRMRRSAIEAYSRDRPGRTKTNDRSASRGRFDSPSKRDRRGDLEA